MFSSGARAGAGRVVHKTWVEILRLGLGHVLKVESMGLVQSLDIRVTRRKEDS